MKSLLAILSRQQILWSLPLILLIVSAPFTVGQIVVDPVFSVERGYHNAAFQLQLSTTTSGANIRYTEDGTTPSAAVGTLYSGPITISTTTPVRAIAYQSALATSAVVTHTYLFIADIISQGTDPSNPANPDPTWSTSLVDSGGLSSESNPIVGEITVPIPPGGYPRVFGVDDSSTLRGEYPADYQMDHEVFTDPAYADLIDDALLAIPSLSVVTDVANLFDPTTGIYYNSRLRGRAYERACSAEYILPDGTSGTTGFAVNCGLRIHGNASRNPRVSPKNSMRLYFRTDYGPDFLNYPLFPDDPEATTSFDKLVLRARSNNSWHHWSRSQRPLALYMRDMWARQTQLEMGHLSSRGTWAHLYINGLYWGLYNLSERLDADYAADYFGGTDNDYDILDRERDETLPEGDFPNTTTQADDGDLVAFNAMMDVVENGDLVSDNVDYFSLLGKDAGGNDDLSLPVYLDVENFADYMILLTYNENTDWPERNWNAIRSRTDPRMGFQWFAWDSELSLKDPNRNLLYPRLPSDDEFTVDFDNTPPRIFYNLCENEEFGMSFADRLYRHLFNGGALSPERALTRFQDLTSRVELPVIAESARWGDYARDTYVRPDRPDSEHPDSFAAPAELYTREDHWRPEKERLEFSYFPVRGNNLLQQFRDSGHYPTINPPDLSQEGGAIEPGLMLAIDNVLPNNSAGDIYYTTDGTDPRLIGGGVAASATNGADSVVVTLPKSTRIKARVYNGIEWSALHEATFLVRENYAGLIINEIMYHTPDVGGINGDFMEFVELYNGGMMPLDVGGVHFSDGIDFEFPPGTIVQAGEYVVCAADPTSFQTHYGFAPFGRYGGGLSNGGERLALMDGFDNLIDELTYDDKAPWATQPDGTGPSLELIQPYFDNAQANAWQASFDASGSTPGGVNSTLGVGVNPCDPPPNLVVINEIHYRPVSLSPDWVELHVPGSIAVDVSGWHFQDSGNNFTIPNGSTIPAGGHLVLVQELLSVFDSLYPGVNRIGELGFGFSGSGEELKLSTQNGCRVDIVEYGDGSGLMSNGRVDDWPTGPDGNGPTLQLIHPLLDNALSASWVASALVDGNPGSANGWAQPANLPPVVSITSPANGDNPATGSTVILQAAASDPDAGDSVASVEYFFGGASLGTAAVSPFTVSWTPTDGPYSIIAKATDTNGFSGASYPVSIIVGDPNIPPKVTLAITPAAPLTVQGIGSCWPSGTSLTLSASPSDSDGGIARVDYYDGSTYIGSIAGPGPYDFLWAPPDGTHKVTAVAVDDLGALGASLLKNVTVINKVPIVEITSPVEGDVLSSGEGVSIEASATDLDGSIASVSFFLDGVFIGTATTAPFEINWTPFAGTFALTAVATDLLGASSESLPVTITVIPGPYVESNCDVVMEGEEPHLNITRGQLWKEIIPGMGSHTFVPVPFSGSGAIFVGPDGGPSNQAPVGTASELIYNINFTNPGDYDIYVRCFGELTDDDSGWYGLDGALLGQISFSAPASDWKWIRKSINIPTAGFHQFNFWMREDGFYVDKFVLTKNAAPSGLGPAPSPRGVANALFMNWLATQFSQTDLDNPALEQTVWGAGADPDGDGLGNAGEAYAGFDANVPNTGIFTYEDPDDAPATNLTIRWRRAVNSHGVEATPMWSLDLVTYYPSGSGPQGGPVFNISTPVEFANNGTWTEMEATVSNVSNVRIFVVLVFDTQG